MKGYRDMTCDIRFLVSGYGNPSETSISLIRADLAAGSFSVEQTFLDRAPSGGITPRDFGAAEDHLIIANQDSDNVTFLRFDRASGRLQSRPFTLTSVKPTCIALL